MPRNRIVIMNQNVIGTTRNKPAPNKSPKNRQSSVNSVRWDGRQRRRHSSSMEEEEEEGQPVPSSGIVCNLMAADVPLSIIASPT